MSDPLQPEILDTLVCEPASRPKGAPAIGEIVPAILTAHRDERQLTVTFDRTATALVGAVVEAERLCCPTIVWKLDAVRSQSCASRRRRANSTSSKRSSHQPILFREC